MVIKCIVVSFAGQHYRGVELQTCIKNATTVFFLIFFCTLFLQTVHNYTIWPSLEEVGHATDM